MKNKFFSLLKFAPHLSGKRATFEFENGYGVSVVFGRMFYSNGVDTYELAVFSNGEIDYSTPITKNVLGHKTEQEIDDVMEQISLLPKVSEMRNFPII